jgi:tRNA-intron lyase
LTDSQIWNAFLDSTLPSRCAVYSYYKIRGWIVRSGSSYGVHYMLYKDSPINNHSEFAVLIHNSNVVDFQFVLTKLRVCANVQKVIIELSLEIDYLYSGIA